MIYVILFIFSYSLTFFIKNYRHKNLLLAQINERSSHTTPTPHGGGIAIALTWFLGLSYLYVMKEIDSSLYFSLMTGTIISVVGYFDDLYELSATIRLGIQSIVAILGLYFIGGFEKFDLFFFSINNQLLTNIFAFFMIVWFINLYNFLDGIDGYAGSEAIFLGISGFLLWGGVHFLILIVAVSGFLIWNWHKSKIFMGDVGSTLLGYNVAIFTIYYANQEASNFWVWIILFELFWFDATLTLFKRYKNGEKLSEAHKKHTYQKLTQFGWSHSKVVKTSIIINIFLFVLIYFFHNIYIIFPISIALLTIIQKLVEHKNI